MFFSTLLLEQPARGRTIRAGRSAIKEWIVKKLCRSPPERYQDDSLDVFADHPTGRSVDTLVHRLRCKIELDPAQPAMIVTVWGEGYKFADVY